MENQEQPNYYAIIPANVRYDKRLTLLSRFLYGEITALANKHGFCFATNNYFATLYDVSKQTISKSINSLLEFEYVKIELIYAANTKEIKQRKIFIANALQNEYLLKENNIPIQNKNDTLLRKNNIPINENLKDNIINNNNTINNTFNTNTEIKISCVDSKKDLQSLISNKQLDFVEKEFSDPFYMFLNYKKNELKFQYKNLDTIKIAYNKLIKLSNNNPEVATEMVEYTIMNSYKGLIEPKGYNGKSNTNNSTNSKPVSSYERSRQLTVSQVETSRAKFIDKFKNSDSIS